MCISTILFHPHVFSQYLNNVTRTTLPNGNYDDTKISSFPKVALMKLAREAILRGGPTLFTA